MEGGGSKGQRSLWLMIKRGELQFRVQGQVSNFGSSGDSHKHLSRIDQEQFHINSSINLFLSRESHYQPLL
jgi:hypothetical protein